MGREEFFTRLQQLQHLMSYVADPGEPWEKFYDRNPQVQHTIKRILVLNGIDPDWVSLPMIDQLIFFENGQPPGLLVRINSPPDTGEEVEPVKPGEEPTLEKAIALIATQTTSVEEAIRLANSVPADKIMSIVDEKMLMQNPELKQQRKKRKNLQSLRADFYKLMSGELNHDGIKREEVTLGKGGRLRSVK